MKTITEITTAINYFFLIYGIILMLIYMIIPIFSASALRFYRNKNREVDYRSMLGFTRLPSVSIIAPAYNEEKSIIENIRCLLSIYYPNLEVIIVNDGSKDNTLSRMIEHFELTEVNLAVDQKIKTNQIRCIYKSLNRAYSSLTVVDKKNGGKADALNAGINVSKNDLFLSIDVDCIIEPDALLRIVKPFLEEENDRPVIASGGVVRVANSCEIENGRVVTVNYPKKFWARFQVLEYFRVFTLGRMAWSKINGLLIISGAFGLFDRERVVKIGGYKTDTVGEDLELVVRLRRYMHEVEKRKYRVAFIPDPLCWTEVPEKFSDLARQRNRWTRGSIDTLLLHRKVFMNKNYGRIGLISFPYWIFFEWLAPIIQAAGVLYFCLLLSLGLLSTEIFLILMLFVLTFSVAYSLFSVFMEVYTYNRYKDRFYIGQILLFSLLEMFIYQPVNTFFALKGNYDYFVKKNRKGWGAMTRTGFGTNG